MKSKVESVRWDQDTLALLLTQGVYDQRNMTVTKKWKGKLGTFVNKAVREKINRDASQRFRYQLLTDEMQRKVMRVNKLQDEINALAEVREEIEEQMRKYNG